MKPIITLVLAAALSATTIGGFTYAQTTGSTTPMMTDDMVTIINVAQQQGSEDDTSKQIPPEFQNATPESMSKAQAELQQDAALMAILQKKNVQLTNVVGVQAAANGGKIVYVK
jgi:hypothetical protein